MAYKPYLISPTILVSQTIGGMVTIFTGEKTENLKGWVSLLKDTSQLVNDWACIQTKKSIAEPELLNSAVSIVHTFAYISSK